MSPADSDDLTTVIEPDGDKFVVLWSPETAEHDPAYRELGFFPTRQQAEAFLAAGQQRLGPARERAIAALSE